MIIIIIIIVIVLIIIIVFIILIIIVVVIIMIIIIIIIIIIIVIISSSSSSSSLSLSLLLLLLLLLSLLLLLLSLLVISKYHSIPMRHKLCRSFHPWCPGVNTRCLAILSSKQTAIESGFGLVVVLNALWCKTREILTGSIQLHTTFLNGNRGDTYSGTTGYLPKKLKYFPVCCKYV